MLSNAHVGLASWTRQHRPLWGLCSCNNMSLNHTLYKGLNTHYQETIAPNSASYPSLFATCKTNWVMVTVCVSAGVLSVSMDGLSVPLVQSMCLFHQPLHVPLSVMNLCVSRVTEDPRGLVEAMDLKERRWDWGRQRKCDLVGGRGEEMSMNEEIVQW